MRPMEMTISFMRGRPYAGYLYLESHRADKSANTKEMRAGLVVDFNADGQPLGVEILRFDATVVADLVELLGELGVDPMPSGELGQLEKLAA